MEQIIAPLTFYGFAGLTVLTSLMVISSRNPVNAVLFLILCFFTTAGLFVLLGAEFLAMILVIVYVGAVAVLFLFVVMMLDVNLAKMRAGYLNYLPLGIVVALTLLAVIGIALYTSVKERYLGAVPIGVEGDITNTEALGRVLYTDYVLNFQLAGLILLVAMIGAIVLTLRHRDGVKRQKISEQVYRDRRSSVKLKKVKTGKGI